MQHEGKCIKVRRMVSGFWGVSKHGRLQSAFDSHAEALAYALILPEVESQIAFSMDKLGEISGVRQR